MWIVLSGNEELKRSEQKAWMIAFVLLGLFSGMVFQQFITMVTQAPLLTKIPNPPSNGNNNTTIPITTTPPNYPVGPVTHFAFYDNGINGGKGQHGVINPSGNIWYLRWHSVAIEEIGIRAGKVLVNYSFYDTNGKFFSDVSVLEFYKGEIKEDLEFVISITETMVLQDQINDATVKIALTGQT